MKMDETLQLYFRIQFYKFKALLFLVENHELPTTILVNNNRSIGMYEKGRLIGDKL